MNPTRPTLALLPAVALLFSCGPVTQTPDDPLEGWSLVWSDEFEGPAGQAPDDANWNYDVGGDGWGNRQLEHNTDRPENVSLDGEGNLAITARLEPFQGNAFTSGRITSAGKVEAEYGRIEARILLPEGRGIWPAFWMLGSNFEQVGWPQCGEIDIMEYLGQDPGIVFGTVHGPGYSAGDSIGEKTAVSGGAGGAFHVYAVEWEESEIRWYVDGVLYNTFTKDDVPAGGRWVYDHPHYLILNVAVGGTLPGNPDASTQFPQSMLVDYVRIYEHDGS